MAYDPELRKAMDEIRKLLKKYDCGGHITLVSKTHGEFTLVVPKWAAIDCDGAKVHIRLHAKSNKEEANLTCHYLYSLRDTCSATFMGLKRMIDEIEKKIGVDHEPFKDFEPTGRN
jgi:hypothetical protein